MSAALDAAFEVQVGGHDATAPFTLEATLQLERGVLVLFGPSGAGKSLALQVLAGLVRPTRGHVRVAGDLLSGDRPRAWVPPHRRGIGYVPQHHALFPFADVRENVLFGLPRARRRDRGAAHALLEELGIAHLAQQRPASLSGGERQRVALARALAVQPRLLLLDEPFASIDRRGREELRGVLAGLLRAHGTPAVFVTHDPEEALALGDRMVRFERGRATEAGAPRDLLRQRGAWMHLHAPAVRAEPLADGRMRLHLSGATLEGAAGALPPGGTPLDLDLRPATPMSGPAPGAPLAHPGDPA